MNYRIYGEDMQVLEVEISSGEKLYSQSGAMVWMDPSVEMKATTGGKGLLDGLWKAAKRMMAGESLALVEYKTTADRAKVAFAMPWIGKINSFEVTPNNSLILQRGAYLAHLGDIDISITFTKRLTAGLFGGEGFILQKLSGQGLVFFFAGGYVKEMELNPSEEILIDTGCIVGFQESVSYEITTVKGIGTWLFGGEGLFLAKLVGPGKVWLQSAPIPTFAGYIAPYLRNLIGK